MANVLVLGAGMMGSALSMPLADRGHSIDLVGTHLDDDIITQLKRDRVHPGLGVELPETVRPHFVGSLGPLVQGANLVALGVNSAGVVWAANQLGKHLRPEVPIFMISKGLSWSDGKLHILPDVFRDALPDALRGIVQPAAVAGPCIAGELARRVETCVVLTGRDQRVLERTHQMVVGDYYHVFVNQDATGIEACAALKNAYAMGIAFAQGLHEKAGGSVGSIAQHNYEAAVFAQAVVEMYRLLELLGGNPKSAVGLAGVGDLNVTCNGGRTGRFGRFLGMGLGRDESIRRMAGATLECLEILGMMRLALVGFQERGLLTSKELPLLRHLISVALDDAPVAMPFEAFG